MSVNVTQLTRDMVAAAKGELSDEWPEIKMYAEAEARKIAETIKMVGKLYAQGKITAAAAKLHLKIQRNAARMVLLTVEGLGILAVEKAINAAVRAIKDSVNAAVGFVLI